jgi:carbonic anhydrase
MSSDETNGQHMCKGYRAPDNDRRQFVGRALSLMSMPLLLSRLGRADAEPKPQNAITPDAALNRLQEGNARYVANALDVKNFSVGRSARSRRSIQSRRF